jgi:hypothetical protein
MYTQTHIHIDYRCALVVSFVTVVIASNSRRRKSFYNDKREDIPQFFMIDQNIPTPSRIVLDVIKLCLSFNQDHMSKLHHLQFLVGTPFS